jgi:hypothetical protein
LLPINFPTPPVLDVDGDSAVTSNDVLTIVNHLNSTSPGLEGGGEGESSDMWLPAGSISSGPANQSTPSTRGSSSKNATTLSATRLDTYLASLGNDMGPSIEIDDLDWAFFGQPEEEEEDDVFGSSLDELLN